VHTLQNHDQIGNRAMGERLHHQIELHVWRALSALLLLSPYTPLLYMGQEWVASITEVLSDREEEVLRRTAWGESNKEIARHLGISTKTVETYKARIADKLGLRSRTEMVRYALRRGWQTET
jgi:DNA-binding NarL/FixJ family response regulator